MREQFLRAGLKELGNGRSADIYLINTCTVTHKADVESLGYIRRSRRENPRSKIIVTGCLVELDGKRIRKEGADLVIKNKDKHRLLQIFSRKNRVRFKNPAPFFQGISDFEGRTRAFLKVQDGCDNFCSYCKVPLVRGRSASRPLDDIIEEAKRLVNNGFKEIVLTGICLGAYSSVGTAYYAVPTGKSANVGAGFKPAPTVNLSLVDVISALEKIDGLLRIRLSSIEAGDVTGALIDKMASSAKLCSHLHIPIQSGDNAILKKMNRKYSREDYLRLIKKIKKQIPGIAITTDVLVGFPGEDKPNFENTVTLIKKMLPLRAHIFPYSKRAGTAAAGMDREVDQMEIKRRISKLKNIVESCARDYKKLFLNKKMDVLIEGRYKANPRFWEGHTANYIKVLVVSKRNLANGLIPLKIKKIVEDYVTGHFC